MMSPLMATTSGTAQPDISVGSLFSGIGGLELGLERAGMRVVWQSEVDRLVRPALHAIGNAVVPQVAEYIGRRILEAAA